MSRFETWRKAGASLLAGVCVAVIGGCAAPTPMTTVADFEVERYLGRWHQIAAIPAWFQADCVSDTTADYGRAEGGLIEVVNACETAEGKRQSAEARGRFTAGESEGRLEVTFVELLGAWVWPAAGNYWILGLGPDYRWSVVGEPTREYAWILARTPSLDGEALREASRIMSREGYDPCALLLTTPEHEGRLCDLVE